MVQAVTGFLEQSPGGLIVDGTAGGGGHLRALRAACPARPLMAFERDPDRAEALAEEFSGDPLTMVHRGSYVCIPGLLDGPASGALFDLGLSSLQLDDPARGFSYRMDGPLDMRFDTSSGDPLSVILESMDEAEVADVIYRLGQEGRSRRIAREIRRAMPVRTSLELRAAVVRAVAGNPVKALSRVFQAFRIMVNDEMGHLERLLSELHSWLVPMARVAFITFHSLEDRAVKLLLRDSAFFRETDPPWAVPSREETRENPRARSARLRTGVRIP
jgi:16S rRNA (cytosine1402-N4)-methyltransferase